MNLLSRVLRIERSEARLAALVVALMFLAMSMFTIGDSAIEALFFDRVGAQALPTMYLLQGGVTFAAMLGLAGTLGRLGPRRAYLIAPIAVAVVLIGERALLALDAAWVYRLLWVTVAVVTLVQGIALWGTAGAVIDTRQAKRLFPIFGAGGILGAVVGGLVTRPLATAIGTKNILIVWAVGLCGVFVLSRLVLGRKAPVGHRRRSARRASALRDIGEGLAFVRRSRLLVWMTIASVLFSVLFYSLFLPFATTVSEHYPDPAKLAGFFGLFGAAVTTAAFVISMLATNRLFVWFGAAAMLVVLPLLYVSAFGVLLVRSGFLTLVALRFTTGTWLQGVAAPGWETLINVVPEGRRDQTRAFINGGPTQIGTVIAGVVALVGQNVLTSSQFAVIGIVAGVLTTVATFGIRRSYAGALADALRAGRPQVFEEAPVRLAPIEVPIDADSIRVLTRALRSPDLRERRLAFQILASVPAGSRPDDVLEGVDDDDPIVRRAAIRALDASGPDGRARLFAKMDDPDVAVAAAAAARGLAVADGDGPRARLRELLDADDPGIRRTAVEELASAPPEARTDLGSALVRDPDPDVRAAALEVVASAASPAALTSALEAMHDPHPVVRRAAGRVLGAASEGTLEPVLEALSDPEVSDAAVEAVRRLQVDGTDERVRAFVRSMGARATRDRDLAAAIPAKLDEEVLLRDAVMDRGRATATSALWAATLLGSQRGEMETAIENLDGPHAAVANALETLEAASEPSLIRPLLALWEHPRHSGGTDDWLGATLHDDDDFVRRCAALVRERREGGDMPDPVMALSLMERVLFLRKVPLFVDLSPKDLERVAELAEERGYADGEVIAAEGETGDELHIVIGGVIRVVADHDGHEHELARRRDGDVVGEMSIITREPRVASLVADGPVRTLRLGQREFESMLRERPGIAMAVMRVLAQRLAETSPRD
jgi:CRP/FNR family transcriptional regulator, cyclic AMP receptor protein